MSAEAPFDYERTDARAGGVVVFAVALSIVIALVLFAMHALYDVLELHAAQDDVAPHPLAVESRPPSPRLQAFPAVELGDYAAAQRRMTESYGWIDVQSGVVRIPVERALELVAERGLPARPAPSERGGEER